MLKKVDDTLQETAHIAEAMDLAYVTDLEPGIRRRKSGRGFAYYDLQNRLLRDESVLARVRTLAIPPAWTDVWISPDEQGHIQATGRDLKGRKQYRYHPRWSLCRDEVKFASLVDFARALPTLRTQVQTDLRRHGLPFEKVVASVVWLLDNSMIRVGNPAYARDNGSFGLTTLRRRHVNVEGAKLRFAFKGKSGKEWRIQLVDRRMARILKSIQELRGQHLFTYLEEDGARRPVRSNDVNDYIREIAGPDFTSKHFRTWGGTIRAASVLAGIEVPQTQTGIRKVLNKAIDQVAAHLGNTRAVCRSCYIHPRVLDTWQAGTLVQGLKSRRRPVEGLDEEEGSVLRFLERS
jgi:DNA topoisomerase-1